MGLQTNFNSFGTINVSLASTNAAVSAISAARVGSAGTSTLGTVGVGKTWYIVGISITGQTANSDEEAYVNLNGVKFGSSQYEYSATTGLGSQGNNYNFAYPFACPVLAAGQTVTLTTAANTRASAVVHYVEV